MGFFALIFFLCWLSLCRTFVLPGGRSRTTVLCRGIEDASKLATYLDRKNRPAHIMIPRRRLELPFAVQCMRSSYNSVDALDFVPMDEFQKSFFLFRQNEWGNYRGYHPTIMQGDLADALYFDFISFAQYAVIADKMREGRQEFIEKQNAAGDNAVVKRAPEFANNNILPQVHARLVGATLLDWIQETYGAVKPPIVPQQPKIGATSAYRESPSAAFAAEAQLLLDIMVLNGYALSAVVELTPPAEQQPVGGNELPCILTVTVKAPANLWSTQALKRRGDSPVNDFEMKVLKEHALRKGFTLEVMNFNVLNTIDAFYTLKLGAAGSPFKELKLSQEAVKMNI
jgi:hypothetical protein